MVRDPLAWPWSTYRDGFDPSVSTEGTLLPAEQGISSRGDLQAAVSELMRVPLVQLQVRGPSRSLWHQCMQATSPLGTSALARQLGLSRATLYRIGRPKPEQLERVLRVAGDPRFPGT